MVLVRRKKFTISIPTKIQPLSNFTLQTPSCPITPIISFAHTFLFKRQYDLGMWLVIDLCIDDGPENDDVVDVFNGQNYVIWG